MKLPGRTEGAVQELVGVDPGVYAQRGQAVAQLGGAVSAIATDWEEKIGFEKNQDAILEVTGAHAKLVEDYGHRRSFTPDEIKKELKMELPESVTHREIVGSGGETRSVKREEIPAEEVWPEYMQRQGEAQIVASAKNIPGSRRRREFERRQEAILVEQYGQAVGKAVKSREAKQITKYERDIANAETAGDYDVAMVLVRQHPLLSDEQKDVEVIRLLQAEEQRHLASLRDHGSDTQLRTELDRLTGKHRDGEGETVPYGRDQEGDRHNSLDAQKLRQEISAISSTLKARKADREKASAANKALAYSNTVDLILDPDSTFEDGANAISRMLSAGMITASQSDALKKLQANRGKIDPDIDKTHEIEALSQDPAKFADADLNLFRGFVDEGVLASYKKRQEDLNNDRGRATTQESVRKTALLALGVDTRPTKLLKNSEAVHQIQLLDSAAQGMIDNYQVKNGVPPVGGDLQDIYRKASQLVRGMDSSEKFKVPGKFRRGSLDRAGVPDDFITDAVSEFTAVGRGDELTNEFIYKLYQERPKK